MFDRQLAGCPPDPDFPDTLHEHGVFINEKNQIRSIEEPSEPVKFKISKNDRYNRLRMESIKSQYQTCWRECTDMS
jgi:hypothetical protein